MKQLLIILTSIVLFFISTISLSYCQLNYKVGDTLYVVAIKGVNLRVAPEIADNVITPLKNGESVIIHKTHIKKGSFEFNGNWTSIYSPEHKTKGYIFDSFISRFPPPDTLKSAKTDRLTYDVSDLSLTPLAEEYFEKYYKSNIRSVSYNNGIDGEGARSFEIFPINDNIRVVKQYLWEGYSIEFELSHASNSEIYYFLENLVKLIPDEFINLTTIDEELINNLKANEDFSQYIFRQNSCYLRNQYSCYITFKNKSNNTISISF
ncbi:MAG: SH3 domain-containing protein [Reichenbachiella sp.]